MSKKTWKDHLLSSGLPLENSVLQELKKYGFLSPHEFHYERKNEQGIPTIFSVDVHATKIFAEKKLWLDLLIECKYRHDSTRWIFNPDEYDWWFGVEFHDAFVGLDSMAWPRCLNRDYLNKNADRYPLCAKGVEIIDNDANPKSIDQALWQLAYAVPNAVAAALNHQASGNDPYIHIIVPIIVTTAELWRVRPNIKVSEVRAAEELENLADKQDILVIHKEPDNELSRYTAQILNMNLEENTKKKVEETWRHGFNHFRATFSGHTPNTFVFMNYSKFDQAVSNLLRFVGSEGFIKTKSEEIGKKGIVGKSS